MINQNAEKQRPFLAGNSILWLGSKCNHKYFAVGEHLVCSRIRADTRFVRLRCPADVLGDKPPSSPADRCTRCAFASSAAGSAKARAPTNDAVEGKGVREGQ